MSSLKQKPDNFKEIIIEFTEKLATTFPEYSNKLLCWVEEGNDIATNKYDLLFNHCLTIYPQKMMDIFYCNEDIFDKNKNGNKIIEFIPNIDFCELFNLDGITEKTKKSIWKYLQMILFLCLPSVKSDKEFGEMSDIFAMMNDGVLNEKMAEIFTSLFENIPDTKTDGNETKDDAKSDNKENEAEDVEESEDSDDEDEGGFMGINFMKFFKGKNMPKLDELQKHMSKLFDGKLGTFAKEMMEELNEEVLEYLGDEYNDVKDMKDAFKILAKNPQKMIGLMKIIQEKLMEKMKNGDISQQDFMDESKKFMDVFKDLGNSKEIKKMMKSFGMNVDKNTKVDFNSMQRNLRHQETKERLKKRFEQKQAMKKMEEEQKQIELKHKLTIATTTSSKNNIPNEFQINKKEEYDIDKIIEEIGLTDKDIITSRTNQKKAKNNNKKTKK